MKVTVDRKTLVRTLKALRELSKEGDKYKDTVALTVKDGTFIAMAGIGTAFIAATLDTEGSKDGTCQVSYRLYDLVKLAKDDTLTLTKGKNLIVEGKSGFRATLTENLQEQIPFQRVLEFVDGGTQGHLELQKEELLYLTDVSKAFPALKGWNYVSVENQDGTIQATVQPSEYGGLDNFPMYGEGENVSYCLHTEYLRAALTFCGNRAMLSTLKTVQGYAYISDPDNPTWFALMGQVARE